MRYSDRNSLSLTCITAAILITGCSSDKDSNDDVPADDGIPTTVLDDTALEQLEGIWEHRGYGDLYAYSDNRTIWYALTQGTCLEITSFEGLAGLSSGEISQTRYDLQGNQLTLALPGEPFVTRYNRLETLPARCNDTVANDAQGIFDYLWTTFDEYYAFFELREVDWASEYARLTPRVSEANDDDALFSLLAELLTPIDDGHVLLVNDSNFFSPAVERGAVLELRQGFQAQTEITDFDIWTDTVFQQFKQVITAQMDVGSVRQQGPLYWATAENGSTGYLFIESMAGYVLDANGEGLEDASTADEVAAASAAMDLAMADLSNTSRLIIDVRLNQGGHDGVSLDFAQRFVSERQLALSKSARSRDFESAPVKAWLEPPATGAYLNPVTLIIGADTASAAEIFTIPMQQLPRVTLIGETTAGGLSDILIKPLPNGWVTGLSNEVYLDAEGVSFEGTGVTPDIEVPVFKLEDIQAGMDPALQRALSLP